MSDEELAAYLHLTPTEVTIVIPRLTPKRRAVYDRMRDVEREAALWIAGVGPKPKGVLIDTERSVSRRKIWGIPAPRSPEGRG